VHIDEVLFAHHLLDHIPEVVGHWVAQALAHQLAGVLHGEFDAQLLVPVGVDRQLALANPAGVEADDALDLEVMLDVELLQSGPDRVKLVASFCI
jgi:hypothetical protein